MQCKVAQRTPDKVPRQELAAGTFTAPGAVVLPLLVCVCRGIQANASALVGNRLSLLLEEDLDEVAGAAVRLRELLPNLVVDKFVEHFPQVLDVSDFEVALEVSRKMTSVSTELCHSVCFRTKSSSA